MIGPHCVQSLAGGRSLGMRSRSITSSNRYALFVPSSLAGAQSGRIKTRSNHSLFLGIDIFSPKIQVYQLNLRIAADENVLWWLITDYTKKNLVSFFSSAGLLSSDREFEWDYLKKEVKVAMVICVRYTPSWSSPLHIHVSQWSLRNNNNKKKIMTYWLLRRINTASIRMRSICLESSLHATILGDPPLQS